MMVYEKPSGQARALRRASILEGSNRKTHCLSCSSAPSHVIHPFIHSFHSFILELDGLRRYVVVNREVDLLAN